jgi:hypothetical protein
MPRITGNYRYHGRAMQTDGSPLYEFEAKAEIVPGDEEGTVQMILQTLHKDSRSISPPVTPRTMPDGTIALLYDYVADPNHAATASHQFFGMVRWRFTPDGRSASGTYLNFNGRYTCGECSLERAET